MRQIMQLSITLVLILTFSTYSYAQLSWTNYQGKIPSNVVIGGEENGQKLPVCRCEYQGGTHPGKVTSNMCHIGYGGKEIYLKTFEVLVNGGATDINWEKVSRNTLPKSAFVGGKENGKPLYVGKAAYSPNGRNLGTHPGKIFTSNNTLICNFGYGGKEIVEKSNFYVLTEQPFQASEIDPNYWYRLTTQWQGDGKSLDIVNDGKNNNQPQLAKTGAFSGQYWKFTPVGNGYYRMTTAWQKDDKSLDIVNDGKNNRPILAKTGNFTGQFWKLIDLKGGFYRMTTAWQKDGKSLDVINDGKNNRVQLAGTGAFSGQYWKLTKIKPIKEEPTTPKFSKIDDKATYLITMPYNGKVLDVPSHSKNDGVQIHQWYRHNGPSQQFRVEPSSDGYYVIQNVNSGKVLDIYNGSKEDGAKVIQWGKHGGPNQQFGFIQTAPDTYIVMNRNSGKVLDVYGGSREDGGKITQYAKHGRENQLFKLVKITPKPATTPTPSVKNDCKAWVWYNNPTSKSTYKPDMSYQYNSEGGAIEGERINTGQYKVIFPGLGKFYNGVCHATAYSGSHSAQVERWAVKGSDLHVFIRTYDAKGNPVDGRFSAIFYKENRKNVNEAYTWVNGQGSQKHAYKFNGKAGDIVVTQKGTGAYEVTFGGITPNNSGEKMANGFEGFKGNVQATAYGSTARRCKIVNWLDKGGDLVVRVETYNFNGQLADSKFVVSYTCEESNEAAFVWANNAKSTANYTPNMTYQMNNAGTADNTITRTGVGTYKVTLPGVKSSQSSNAIATAYGSTLAYASVQSWNTNNSVRGTDVIVKCFAPNGQPIDSQFSLLYNTNNPSRTKATPVRRQPNVNTKTDIRSRGRGRN